MCIGKLFGFGKSSTPAAPKLPPPPPIPSPPPTPTPVESQTQAQDARTRRRRQLRSGLLSTIKTRGGGIFGRQAELSGSGAGNTVLG